MAIIKQISVYDGNSWTLDDIGVNAENVSLSSNSTVTLNSILPADKLTTSKALMTDGNGVITTSGVSSSQLGYLSGVSSNIQTQINSLNIKIGESSLLPDSNHSTNYNIQQLNTNLGNYVPKTRKIGSVDLSADRTVANIGAAPTSHASTATTYGVGTTANYGHCMTINNLTTSAHANGKALSAYQGYVLNSKIKFTTQTASFNDKNIANATNTELGTITLAAGTWILIASARCLGTGAVNNRFAGLISTAAASSWSAVDRFSTWTVSLDAAGSTVYIPGFCITVVSPTASTVYRLHVYQNSGSTKTVSLSGMLAIKVG